MLLTLLNIDTICANQDDLVERSEQVKLMKTFTLKPGEFVVWFGEDDEDNAEPAIKVTKKAAEYCEYCYSDSGASLDGNNLDSILRTFHPDFELPWSEKKQERNFPGSTYELNTTSSRDWAAISRFYSNTWFTRIWIVQESCFRTSCHVYWCSRSWLDLCHRSG